MELCAPSLLLFIGFISCVQLVEATLQKLTIKIRILSGEIMYLDKEKLKNASIEDILKELIIIEEEFSSGTHHQYSSSKRSLRAYIERLFEELKTRI